MKERFGRVGAKETGSNLPKFAVRAKFALAMITLFALCVSAMAQENTAEGWYKKGLELDSKGSYNESFQAYEKALEQDPNSTDAWLGKADVLFSLSGILHQPGKLDESLQAYDVAIRLIPATSTKKLAEAWNRKAFVLANLADFKGHDEELYNESIKAYDKAVELDLQNVDARAGKAAVLATRLNRTVEALDASNSAVEMSLENSIDRESMIMALDINGLSLVKAGKYEEAIQTYDRLLKIAPQNTYNYSFAWRGKGDALLGMKKYEEAIKAYDKALETYPSSMDKFLSSGIWQGKGDALEAMGRHEEAIAAYDNDLDAHPKDAPAMYKKGQILKALGRNPEADIALVKAKELGYEG